MYVALTPAMQSRYASSSAFGVGKNGCRHPYTYDSLRSYLYIVATGFAGCVTLAKGDSRLVVQDEFKSSWVQPAANSRLFRLLPLHFDGASLIWLTDPAPP